MSPQKQHVIHGRDHTANGSDPIPGIGASGALEWEDVGTGGTPPPTAANPRFVSAYHTASGGVTSGSEWPVPFAFDACVSNDDPADAGYQTAQGSYVSAASWTGDYFLAPSASGQAFQVARIDGLYLILAQIYCYTPSTANVTVRVTLPWANATQGFGTGVTISGHEYQEIVAFGPATAQRFWTRSWLCVMNALSPAGAQPCGMYVTQTTGATLTSGPPQFSLAAYRLNLP